MINKLAFTIHMNQKLLVRDKVATSFDPYVQAYLFVLFEYIQIYTSSTWNIYWTCSDNPKNVVHHVTSTGNPPWATWIFKKGDSLLTLLPPERCQWLNNVEHLELSQVVVGRVNPPFLCWFASISMRSMFGRKGSCLRSCANLLSSLDMFFLVKSCQICVVLSQGEVENWTLISPWFDFCSQGVWKLADK